MSKGGKSPFAVVVANMKVEEPYINKFDYTNNLAPLSGAEPKYEPMKWNKGKIKENHNCYAYALNKFAPNRGDKSQPGYFSNFPPLRETDYSCATFATRMKKDNPGLYISDFNTKCKPHMHKGFLAIASGEDFDYHFWSQDDNGYWSHKPGRTDAKDTDGKGKKIKNPLMADRSSSSFDYDTPCFFFCVNSKLSSLRSSTNSH